MAKGDSAAVDVQAFTINHPQRRIAFEVFFGESSGCEGAFTSNRLCSKSLVEFDQIEVAERESTL